MEPLRFALSVSIRIAHSLRESRGVALSLPGVEFQGTASPTDSRVVRQLFTALGADEFRLYWGRIECCEACVDVSLRDLRSVESAVLEARVALGDDRIRASHALVEGLYNALKEFHRFRREFTPNAARNTPWGEVGNERSLYLDAMHALREHLIRVSRQLAVLIGETLPFGNPSRLSGEWPHDRYEPSTEYRQLLRGTSRARGNVLAKFLAQRSVCEKLVCGTCGGQLAYSAELEQLVQSPSDLEDLLATLQPWNVRSPSHAARAVVQLIGRLPAAEQARVLDSWRGGTLAEPTLAFAILAFAPELLGRSEAVRADILHALLPIAIKPRTTDQSHQRRVRDQLERHFQAELSVDIEFSSLREIDRADDARRRHAEGQERRRLRQAAVLAEEARQRREAGISLVDNLPVLERLRLIAYGATGVEPPLPEHWAEVGDAEIRAIPEEVRIALKQRLRHNRSGPWSALRQQIHFIQSENRSAQRSEFLALLATLSREEQLNTLVRGSEKLGWFPESLAAWARENVDKIPEEMRSALRDRIGNHRGEWRQLKRTLSSL